RAGVPTRVCVRERVQHGVSARGGLLATGLSPSPPATPPGGPAARRRSARVAASPSSGRSSRGQDAARRAPAGRRPVAPLVTSTLQSVVIKAELGDGRTW